MPTVEEKCTGCGQGFTTGLAPCPICGSFDKVEVLKGTEEIREKLAKGGIRCQTVGEIKELLKHVPDDLPCRIWDEPVEVVWYNKGFGDQTGISEHLSFREPID